MPYKPDGSPPSTGEMSEGQRGSAYHHEEQGSLENHHSGGGVYPDGSVDCLGNDLMHEMHAVEWKM